MEKIVRSLRFNPVWGEVYRCPRDIKDGEKIILTKYVPGCIFCDNVNNVQNYKGKVSMR